MSRENDRLYKPETTKDSKSGLVGSIVALMLIGLVLFYYFFWQPQQVSQTPQLVNTTVDSTAEKTVPSAAIEDIDDPFEDYADIDMGTPLPALDESDEFALAALANFVTGNEWLQWISTDEVLRKLVVVVDNIADGKVAQKYISIPKPQTPFKVEEIGQREYLMSDSFERYTRYIEVFDAIDNELIVSTYHQLSPLLEQAYAELGYPDRTFESTLLRALDFILDTPQFPGGEIELMHTSVVYKYADKKLENLPAVHKQILRMGPQNAAVARSKIQALKTALTQ